MLIYFPGGKTRLAGQLENLKKVLTDSSEGIIVTFLGKGTIADYLNANGMYPSSTFFCLRAEFDEDDKAENITPLTFPSLISNENEPLFVAKFNSFEDETPSLLADHVNDPSQPRHLLQRAVCEVCFNKHELGT